MKNLLSNMKSNMKDCLSLSVLLKIRPCWVKLCIATVGGVVNEQYKRWMMMTKDVFSICTANGLQGKAYGLGRSTSVQNPPRVQHNQIIGVVRPRPEDIEEFPNIGTSLNVELVSEVSPVQQNTKKRRVMVAPNEDGEVEPSTADIMAGFLDVPVMAAYSLAGEKNGGEDVPIAPWSEKRCDLGGETQAVDSHGHPSPEGKSTKGRSRSFIVEPFIILSGRCVRMFVCAYMMGFSLTVMRFCLVCC
ncbi:hypothetical protein Pyn_36072 [Prunus yedoensis var. nudiflora]|uniref:Uncharacterized protein n=1 Tax=Prunus yedoensis var. nudiflora TaxID=2094558 RepID=A0A314XKR7_PRUYE|nr:hypothetical protein Pyn_36072 [Prunus yedoensis var. nudiflora]